MRTEFHFLELLDTFFSSIVVTFCCLGQTFDDVDDDADDSVGIGYHRVVSGGQGEGEGRGVRTRVRQEAGDSPIFSECKNGKKNKETKLFFSDEKKN